MRKPTWQLGWKSSSAHKNGVMHAFQFVLCSEAACEAQRHALAKEPTHRGVVGALSHSPGICQGQPPRRHKLHQRQHCGVGDPVLGGCRCARAQRNVVEGMSVLGGGRGG
jgi:hypothetical protein